MCFTDDVDYEWFASVQQVTDRLAPKPTACSECGCKIPLGAKVREIFQQEHERCQICEDDESESFIGIDDEFDFRPEKWSERMKILREHSCRYGETFLYRRCDLCSKLIAAIEAHEEREGCPPDSRTPPLCELMNALWEHESRYEYATAAVTMFEELWNHPFVIDLLQRDDRWFRSLLLNN